MAMELPDGKTARNIQEQVKFLTEKLKDLYARVNDLEVKIVKVDELPEEGEFGTIYLLPVEDPEEGNYFEEYIYFDGEWELIGTTQIDLSGYVDLTSAQTITGTKSFALSDSQDYKGVITPLSSGFKLGTNVMDSLRFAGYGMYAMSKFIPEDNGTLDLGQGDLAWKDLYLGGKTYFAEGGAAHTLSERNWYVYHNQYNELVIGRTYNSIAADKITINGGTIYTKDNNGNLGTSSNVWKDLYLSDGVIFKYGTTGTIDWKLEVGGDYSFGFVRDNVNLISYITTQGFGFNGDVYSQNNQDLGKSGSAWKDLYLSGNINLQNPNYSGTHSQIFESQYGRLFFKTNGSNAMEIQSANIVFSRSLIGNNLNIGSNDYKWQNLYLSGNISDGTNSVSVAQIASGLGGTYRHRIDIETNSEDIQINVNLNTSTAINTLALLDSIKNNLLGSTIMLDAQGSYSLAVLNSITVNVGAGTATFEYLDAQGVHTLNYVDFYQDTVYQL